MTKEEQKQEALKRMKLIKLMPQVIKDFKKGILYYSERQSNFFPSTLYYVQNNWEYVSIIKEFECLNNAVVYHSQLTHTQFGDLLSLFYVSDNQEEWEMDNQDLKNGYAFVKVINLDDPNSSEFGTIQFKSIYGGIVRIA